MAMLAGIAGGAGAAGAAGAAGGSSGILGSILGGVLGGGGGGGGASAGQSAPAARQGFNWGGFGDFMVGAGKGALHGIGEGIESYIRSETQQRPGVMMGGGGYHGAPTGPFSSDANAGILALITSGRRGGGMRLG